MTHYDTLKVTQDAPVEVINAAYKALALIYHPDRNINNAAEAMAKMQDINIAYKVLSDPQKRAEHDTWINSRERRSRPASDGRRKVDLAEKEKTDKVVAEASKWTVWADKMAQEAKEAQAKLEKAKADLAKAKEADRPKWETWVAKLAQEAKEANERAEKAAVQAEKARTDAVNASTQGK